MKKIVLSALAIFAFGFANAQDSEGMKFGIKAGLNMSNLTGDADGDGKTGFFVGGLVDFSVAENFHVQPELQYSSEGADEAGISYLRIPIMAKYYVMEGLSLQAGPSIAFKIGAEDDFIDENTKSLDFGLGIGAGYELPMGVMFDVRYTLGLSDISDGEAADAGFETKTTMFQIGVGYRF